jgi:hypothetical protein
LLSFIVSKCFHQHRILGHPQSVLLHNISTQCKCFLGIDSASTKFCFNALFRNPSNESSLLYISVDIKPQDGDSMFS